MEQVSCCSRHWMLGETSRFAHLMIDDAERSGLALGQVHRTNDAESIPGFEE